MPRHIALLRGINVGGHNRLPMADLRRIFEEVGATDVATYIQSGNVVFRGDLSMGEAVTAALQAQLGLSIPLVMRTHAQWVAAMDAQPYAAGEPEPKRLHIGFLMDQPDPARVAALDPDRSVPDRFTVIGGEIHVHVPNGLARSKLSNAWFDRQLGTRSTWRNWRTCLKLRELSA